jgi:hypothetical protein
MRTIRMGGMDSLLFYCAEFRMGVIESRDENGRDAFGKELLVDMFLEGLAPALRERIGIDRNGVTLVARYHMNRILPSCYLPKPMRTSAALSWTPEHHTPLSLSRLHTGSKQSR